MDVRTNSILIRRGWEVRSGAGTAIRSSWTPSASDLMIFEYPNAIRWIPLDGRPHELDPDPACMGSSVGRWDGDTLVVDAIGFRSDDFRVPERHPLDSAGWTSARTRS